MPVYEFACNECGKEAEAFVELEHYDDPHFYPKCCGGTMRREMRTPPNFATRSWMPQPGEMNGEKDALLAEHVFSKDNREI